MHKYKTFKTYGKSKTNCVLRTSDWDAIFVDSPTKRCVGLLNYQTEDFTDASFNEIKFTPVKSTDRFTKITCWDQLNPRVEIEPLPLQCQSTPLSRREASTTPPPLENTFTALTSPVTTAVETESVNSSYCRSVSFVFSGKKCRMKNFHSNLSLETDGLQLSDLVTSLGTSLQETLSHCERVVKKLHSFCEQTDVITFAEYMETRDFDCKIGEGSYGEVYLTRDKQTAVKVVPVCEQKMDANSQMTFHEIISEIAICKKLSEISNQHGSGFLPVQRVVHCKGVYPKKLKRLWETWKGESENVDPGGFDVRQKYVIIEMPYGGVDLESFDMKSFKEAKSILTQVVRSISIAERIFAFEHRDLHWGNVLVERCSKSVDVRIVDFTMSRLVADGCAVFTDLKDERDLFMGEGDEQFDVYRSMKSVTNDDWKSFHPFTNVLWVRYIANKLILKMGTGGTITLKRFAARCETYANCEQMYENDALFKCKKP